MQPLPIGIQTFKDLREGNYLYIDKTHKIFPLVEQAKGAFFLSRPRRCGKSLTLSVLDEIFSANKELFRGLWIYDSPYEWTKHLVLRFDFSKQKAVTQEELIRFIFSELDLNAKRHSVNLESKDYFAQFQELITKLGSTGKVVILIDEYDKPIIDHLENTEKALEMREIMKGFFTILKGSDPYIRFLLLTGVSKFSKAGVFSNLNHLRDILINIEYDIQIQQEKYYQTIFYLIFNLLGYYIHTEVKTNRGRIDAVVEGKSIYLFEFKLNGTKEEALQQIKDKKYYEKYISKGKPIYLVGLEFRDKNVGEYLVERL
jgi:hypothetical protein